MTTGTVRPWSPALTRLRAARLHVQQGAGSDVPVLLHQGFLIETAHVWRPLAAALAAAGRTTMTVDEHYLRTIDSAHALGHDPDLALAQSLADALAEHDAAQYDIAAEGTGAAPALLLALNDSRVRRVVLWRPARIGLDETGTMTATEIVPGAMTDAEVSIGVLCAHTEIEVVPPAEAVRRAPADIDVPVLIVDAPDASPALRSSIPMARSITVPDRQHMLGDATLIRQAVDFLAAPITQKLP